MDVLVQHHPEYVALAWRAMKFVFVVSHLNLRHGGSEIDRHQAFLNHEAVISSLAKALSQIADALPRIDLSKTLYPTKRMQQAVIELYAHLIRFLIRSYDWY